MKPILAKPYNNTNPRGWWMSEKFDGVRCIWNGAEFVSRNGNVFEVPQSMKRQMPKGLILDGEVFGGRGTFQDSVGSIKNGEWSEMSFMVFDVVNDSAFESRQKTLAGIELPEWCQVVEQVKCRSMAHFEEYEQAMVDAGAEGVILRAARSKYKHGRSSQFLKVKRWTDDEAKVVSISGHVLTCEWMGKIIKLTIYNMKAIIGDLITFIYTGTTKAGLPRHTKTIAIRNYE